MTQGKTAIIDDTDWPIIAGYTWYATKSYNTWYAVAAIPGRRRKARVKMHNLILGRKNVDHRDSDGLNNRRSNLRPCNDAQNQQNNGSRGGSSKFKGVSWVMRRKKWLVAFRCNNQYHFVGWFADEIEAAKAYDAAILPLAGDFARLNFKQAV